MTVLKSNVVTTEDAGGDQVASGNAGSVRCQIAKITTPTIVADNDVILLCKVPTNAVITSVVFASDDLGSGGDFNVGLYDADRNVVDEDCIATALDVNASATAPTEIRFEVKAIETIDSKAWEIAGLSAEPAYNEFYLAITASEATSAAGDVTIKVEYVV